MAIGGGVLVVLLVVLAISNSKKPKKEDVATTNGTTEQMHSGTLSADPNGNKVPDPPSTTPDASPPDTTTPDAAAGTDTDTPDDTQPDTGGDSGIGGTDAADPDEPKRKGVTHYVYLSDDKLYIKHESTPETTEEERAEIDALVATMVDFDAGREAVVAEGKVLKFGKKAIPSLLSTFVGQTWEDQNEQFSAFKVQQALRTIVRADLPKNRDFIARFNPANPVPAKNFKSATKMWICHWLGHLRYQDEFKQFDDSEEE